ncbi:MAG: hypothetical protein GEU99_10995 [Luteitalea sp.]|nr:hypothetical protein [Luteitalea sp.]
MHTHADLVGRLHVIAGALAGLAACALCALGLGALGLTGAEEVSVAASLTAGVFFGVAALLLLWAAASAGAGLAVRSHRPWARPAAFVLSVLDLFMVPFGTALGLYTIWVLIHPETRRLFGVKG